jgi:hypothetical protein
MKIRYNFKLNWKYAIGELVLIFCAFTLAIGFENWREKRNNTKTEIFILREMSSNLDSDKDLLRNIFRDDSLTYRSQKIVLNHLENCLPYHDSLAAHFGRLGRARTFINLSSAYQTLNSIGLTFISNESVRSKIVNYYDFEIDGYFSFEKHMFLSYELDVVRPSMIKRFHYSTFVDPAYPVDYSSLCSDYEFLSTIKSINRIIGGKMAQTQSLYEKTDDLKIIIQEEIKRLE